MPFVNPTPPDEPDWLSDLRAEHGPITDDEKHAAYDMYLSIKLELKAADELKALQESLEASPDES